MDVKRVLDHFQIDYVTEHPKVGKGCVGVCCPLCGEKNYKRGIFLTNGVNSCWACRNPMSLPKLLWELKRVSYSDYCSVIGIPKHDSSKKNLDEIFHPEQEIIKEEKAFQWEIFVKHFRQDFDYPIIQNFLKKREFEEDDLWLYDCYYAIAGEYLGRLIIPIKDNKNHIVSFAAYDLARTSKQKYLFPSHSNVHHYLYSSKYIESKKVFLVEGIFDAWRVGSVFQSYAMFGKVLHPSQLLYLLEITSKDTEIAIMLDGDTKPKESETILSMIQPFFEKVSQHNLPKEHDPDSYFHSKMASWKV